MTDESIPTNQARTQSAGTATPENSADAPTTEFALPGLGAATSAGRNQPAGGEPAGGEPAEAEAVDPISADPGGSVRWRRRGVIIPAAVVGGLLLLYGVAFLIAGGGLARNATVLGVEVGGLAPAEAEARLAAELPARVDEPIDVEVPDGSTFSVVPSEAGLSVDYSATVTTIPGGSPHPASLFRALFGGGEVDPVPVVDRAALESAVTDIAEDSDIEPVNGGVAFEDAEIITSPAEHGTAIDVTTTADTLEAEYFGPEAGPHTLPLGPVVAQVEAVEPAITDAEVERAVAEFAEPAMSGPVQVTAGDQTFELTPGMISAGLSMSSNGSARLTPELNPGLLAEAAGDVLTEVGQPGRNATIRIEGGSPVVVPHEAGFGVDADELASAVLPVLTATGDERTATVEASEQQPEFTTEDAEALGVTEIISEFTTYFVPSSYRNTNIGLAASKINNTLLLPGDTFSLNGIVGERTAANGFVRGGVIQGGQLVEAYGGGVSQVATTTYHTAFQAGLEDVEHQPHSIYYSHYPVGQEATVSWGNFDMAFRNDTPYGVLVQTVFRPSIPGQGSLTVRLWSTEYFEVETSTSERSNFTDPPDPIYSSADDCFPNQPSRGFSITSFRKVWDPDGNVVKDEANPWTYRPSPEVICGEEPDDD